jgi:hypothetical protein
MLVTKRQHTPEKIELDFDFDKFKFDLSTENLTQEKILTIQGKTILTLGSFLVLTGKPKARKTTFLHAIIETLITGNEKFTIQGELNNKNKIALVDTEQSIFDLYQSLNRLATGLNCKLKEVPNLDVYTARAGDVNLIKKLITTICEKTENLGVICIDGLIDLVDDINDVRQAKEAINFIKSIADKFNVSIIGILHQNKGTNFSLGHLGSFASRFAQSELSIEKNESGTSTMRSVFLRSAGDIQDIEIEYNEIKGVYQLANLQDTAINALNLNYDYSILIQIFGRNPNFGVTYTQLIELFVSHFQATKYEAKNKILPYCFDNNFIEKKDKFYYLTR